MITDFEAVESLRPGARFVLVEDEVENIEWHTEGVEPVTRAEVDEEKARLEGLLVQQQEQQVIDRQSAAEKLTAIGLTDGEVSAVIGVQL